MRLVRFASSCTLSAAAASVVIGCGQTSAIQSTATSKSQFEGAAFAGETVTLGEPVKGSEEFRLFQQGATGYVSLQSVRDDVEQRADRFCERKGLGMRAIRETTSKPPFILGNFPRAELVFQCVEKAGAAAGTEDAKFIKLTNLKKLLDGGVLTQAEFEREKAKILSQP